MKEFGVKLARLSFDRPKSTTAFILLPTLVLMLLAALPSIWPGTFQGLNSVRIDTDPENMLSKDEAVRVFHDDMKELFDLNDMVVVGVINEKHPQGVFNKASLANIYALTEFAEGLTWPDPDSPDDEIGVIEADVIAPSAVDNIESGGLGVVKFEWLMPQPPETDEKALAILHKARDIPFLDGTLVSEDGKAIAIYLPLTSKDLSHRVYTELKSKIAEFEGADKFYITGLPVAEDTFGHQMFIQMGISAPLAMLAIFLLMLFFFRKLSLIVSPLIVAMISVIMTMSLLVITGQTIHIMSSMIPIFIMPIAVLDSVHILSMFFDRYQQKKNRRETMMDVMAALFMPMLYTSLTSAAGFASLALTPIPPVQVFGIFCAFGIMAAWILTITFIPAYVAFLPESWLKNFGTNAKDSEAPHGPLTRILDFLGEKTYSAAVPILIATVAVIAAAIYGITQIRINDNPIKWFEKQHPIREADRVLNDHFGGTYMSYLALRAGDEGLAGAEYAGELKDRLQAKLDEAESGSPDQRVYQTLVDQLANMSVEGVNAKEILGRLNETARQHADDADDDDLYYAWDDASLFIEKQIQSFETFKQPEVLQYISKVQKYLESVQDEEGNAIVGKSNSLSDIVKTVHRALRDGDDEYFSIPGSPEAVAQCLIQYQSSHRPQDLWHFTSSDYRDSSVWFQLRSGDNIQMERVAKALRAYEKDNPPPAGINMNWFGLTYINVVWQDKMVSGMLFAFLGSFLVVFLMMTLLFRSALWGILCMIPLTVTIAFIYGAIGFVGKDYDMPVAVLSALALGLAVDFAIHFLEHARVLRYEEGDWRSALQHVFRDPARAIVRNIIVIAVGFLPLLAAPLVPYQTVGIFLASILAVSGLATLFILPALVRLLERFLFPESRVCCVSCNCVTCIAASVSLVILLVINIKQFMDVGWTALSWISLLVIPVLALACRFLSHREKCQLEAEAKATSPERDAG